ncbi:hypothetical protein LMTR3_21700 [Bradyrhizobium sp. LMTR 3]|nr:hypothetical protein LMTR3_21700 [Bradyrhizobium sp. LMTR 3]
MQSRREARACAETVGDTTTSGGDQAGRQHSRADFWRHRHSRPLATLGAHHQDRVIPPSHRGGPIATMQDLLDLRGG